VQRGLRKRAGALALHLLYPLHDLRNVVPGDVIVPGERLLSVHL
jgi:hypothetical protein